MPTASRTAVCSLTTPEGYSSGIDQPPNSANLAPSATCRSCSGEVSRSAGGWLVGHGREPTAATGRRPGGWLSCPGDVLHPAQRQPRQDPQPTPSSSASCRTDKGVELAPGGEDVAKAYGRKLRPLLATLGVTGKAGEVVKVPDRRHAHLAPAGARRPRQGGRTPTPCAAAAGAAARAVTNAASVAARAARRHRRAGARGDRGLPLGGYTFTTYKKDAKKDDTAPGEVVVLSPVGAQEGRRRGVRGGPGRGPAPSPPPATGSTRPPGDLTPADVRRRRRARRPRSSTKGRGAPKVGDPRPRREARSPSSAAAASSASAPGSAAPPRLVELHLRPQGRDGAPRAGRQGHHLRLRRPDHQAGPEHGRDEVRHGRRRRGRRRRRSRSPSSGLPVKVTHASRRWPRTWSPAPRPAPATC